MEDAIRDQENLLQKLKTQIIVKAKILHMKTKTAAAMNKQLPSESILDENQTAKKPRIESEKLVETLSPSPKCLTLIGVTATMMGMSMISSQDTQEQQINRNSENQKVTLLMQENLRKKMMTKIRMTKSQPQRKVKVVQDRQNKQHRLPPQIQNHHQHLQELLIIKKTL